MYPPPVGIVKMHDRNDKLGFAERRGLCALVRVCLYIKKTITPRDSSYKVIFHRSDYSRPFEIQAKVGSLRR